MLGSIIRTWLQGNHHADNFTLAAAPQLPPSLSEGTFHEGQLDLTGAHKAMVSWCSHWPFFSRSETSLFLFLAYMAKQCPPVSPGITSLLQVAPNENAST